MRRLASTLALLFVLATPVGASEVVTFESVTVSSTAIGLSATTTDPTGQFPINRCSVTSETADVRYRYSTDNVAATATVGQFLAAGASLLIDSHEDAVRITFIRDAAADATVQVHCWLQGRT